MSGVVRLVIACCACGVFVTAGLPCLTGCRSESNGPGPPEAVTPPPVKNLDEVPSALRAEAPDAPSVASAVPKPVEPDSDPKTAASSAGATTRLAPTAAGRAPLPGPSARASASPSVAPSSAPSPPALGALQAIAPRRGAIASAESYQAWLETTGSYSAKTPASVTVVLVAKAPFHCNEQYPYKITLDRAPGVTFPNPIARGMRVNGTRATLSVPFSADSAGQFVISGTFAFSTCSADRCLIDKAKLSVPIDVR